MCSVEIDLHGLTLFEVQVELIDKIIDLYYGGHGAIRLIHGYHHGQTIKQYIYKSLMIDFKKIYPKYQVILKKENLGSTIIQILTNQ